MKTQNTFRKERKVIAEGKDQRDQISTLSDVADKVEGLNPKLDELQSATELVAETVESKSQDIVDAVEEVSAGVELNAEKAEEQASLLRDIDKTTRSISEKLAEFSDKLKAQLVQATPNLPAVLANTQPEAEKAIEDEIPVEVEAPGLEDLITKLLPDADFPIEDVIIPPEEPVAKEPTKESSSDKMDRILEQLSNLNKSVSGGFKQSIAFSDKISSMLFKYTISAVAQAAKTAAIILSIIFAIDVIRAHFQHWSKILDTGIANLQEKLGSLAEPFLSLSGLIDNFITSWTNGEFTKAIVGGLQDSLRMADDLGEAMLYGLGKMTAAILRHFGQDEAADDMIKSSAERYSEISGHVASKEDQEVINRVKARDYDKNKESVMDRVKQTSSGVVMIEAAKALWQGKNSGTHTPEVNPDKGLDMSDENIKRMIETETKSQMDINSVRVNAERFRSDPEKLNELQATLDQVKDSLNNQRLPYAKTQQLNKSIAEQQATLDKYKNPEVKPQAAAEKEEAVKTTVVEKLQEAKTKETSKAASGQTDVNVNNTKVSKTTNVTMGRPRTSIDDPGMATTRTV
ncbi:baseplate hub subunit and tail length [Serratia phage 92A1]|nr:baseplate hub subunit and tail length [Serratia phage 92A1]